MCNTAKILDKNLVGFASEKALRELGALCIIELQFQIDSCNEVLRARAETITPAETLTFRASDSLGASFLFA